MSETTTSPDQDGIGSTESLLESNPQLLNVMLAALSEEPLAQELSQDSLISICEAAFQAGKLNDRNWLKEQLETFRKHSPTAPPQPSKKPAYAEITVSKPCQPTDEEQWQEIITRHHEWIASVLHPSKPSSGGRANLTAADLRAFDLTGLDLRGAILNEANLQGCSLRKANLSTALLRQANLVDTNLEGAILRRADLSGCKLEKARLHACDLRRALTDGVDFSTAAGVDDAIRS